MKRNPITGRAGSASLHAQNNGRVVTGRSPAVGWNPGEMQELITKALQDGKVTKCQSADVTHKPVFGFDESSFEGGKI